MKGSFSKPPAEVSTALETASFSFFSMRVSPEISRYQSRLAGLKTFPYDGTFRPLTGTNLEG